MEVPLEKFRVDDRHKWLYSVVPRFPEGGIYLAGFCPQCRNAFTVRLQEDDTVGFIQLRKLDVPAKGCEPV